MKLFCAGADSLNFMWMVAMADHPYMLTSYYNTVRGRDAQTYGRAYQKLMRMGAEWIMDSGLFTMMFGAEKGVKRTHDELEAYTHTYLDDMEAIGYQGTVVEMDVHKVLGLESLAKLRAVFAKRWAPERTIFVWHLEEGETGWGDLVRQYPYVAISIPELRIICKGPKHIETAVKSMIGKARDIRPNVKIHLLGCTQPTLLMQPGFTTCDSTSWIAPGKFGRGFLFRSSGRLHTISTRQTEFQRLVNEKRPLYDARLRRLTDEGYQELTDASKSYAFANAVQVSEMNKMNRWVNARHYSGEPVRSLWATERTAA